MKTNRRLKVYGIAIPVFLIITLIGGALAQIGGVEYRQSYYAAGAQMGYLVGFSQGYSYGGYVGYMYGYEAGAQYGYAMGTMESYVETVIDMDNPAHLAALKLERSFLEIDVVAIVTLPMQGAEGIVVIIGYPFYFDETRHPNVIPIDQWDSALVDAIVNMVQSVYAGEKYVKLVAVATTNLSPFYYYIYDRVTYAAQPFLQGDWSNGVHDEQFPLSSQDAVQFGGYGKSTSMWPFNPYAIEAAREQSAVRGSGGSEGNTSQ